MLRVTRAQEPFMRFVQASRYPYAVMAAGKGQLPEDNEQWMGTYWGQVPMDGLLLKGGLVRGKGGRCCVCVPDAAVNDDCAA